MEPVAKFTDRALTAKGEPRAWVAFEGLRTLWVNTGTVCNLECPGCYIESSPHNERLSWFLPEDLRALLAEAKATDAPLTTVGFTGGEPFANPYILELLTISLEAGLAVLVLSNGTTPLRLRQQGLISLGRRFPGQLSVRVSLDHATAERHDSLRGKGMFAAACAGVSWLLGQGFAVAIAGRSAWGETPEQAQQAYQALFNAQSWPLEAARHLVVFPEMEDPQREAQKVPEITTACWDILHLSPAQMMCASARMAVRRQGAATAALLACTLIAYDPRFEMGASLAEAAQPVSLQHPHCARFCVLGGASCSG